jgi:type I restriction-modification system DNA methylase subunit
MFACCLSLADRQNFEKRRELYSMTTKKYNEDEMQVFGEIGDCVTNAFEENRNQDFLGDIYMNLNLGSNQMGQFFTPYNVAFMMAKMTMGDPHPYIKQKGYVEINDPTCGAGVTLIAAANTLEEQGVNFQNSALFVGQDIDYVACLMCYIQLSLLGCAGYIIRGNTLTAEPPTDIWFMPMYFLNPVWEFRRVKAEIGKSMFTETPVIESESIETQNVAAQLFEEKQTGQLTMF